jgi:hypothetical protein
MAKVKNLVGQKFGKLIVLYLDHTDERGAWWACQCDCENTTIVVAGNLKSGNTTCCNECAKNKLIERNKANATHGETNTRLYRIWRHMRERCQKDYSSAKKWYKDRGIVVWDEWEKYENFRDWALNNGYDEDLSIDRIDNNGNYCPENCRWVDDITQANNTSTNTFITINGIIKTAKNWERISGIESHTLLYRLKHLWPENHLLDKPNHGNKVSRWNQQ